MLSASLNKTFPSHSPCCQGALRQAVVGERRARVATADGGEHRPLRRVHQARGVRGHVQQEWQSGRLHRAQIPLHDETRTHGPQPT